MQTATVVTMKTNAEIRRKNARALAREIGKPADLARRLEMSDSQMGQLIGENPVRNIGPGIARRIEAACGKPEGWLDVEHSYSHDGGVSLRALQIREATKILEAMADAQLSAALGWLQLHSDQNSEKVNRKSEVNDGNITGSRQQKATGEVTRGPEAGSKRGTTIVRPGDERTFGVRHAKQQPGKRSANSNKS